jgi:hypothetical protein
MTEEPILEYLTSQLRGHDQPEKSFNLNQFRSLDPGPPQMQKPARDMADEKLRVFMQRDEEFAELYAEVQWAQRLCDDLEVAEKILSDRVAKHKMD